MSDRIWDDPRGRPKPEESARRRREFLRLLGEGAGFGEAQRESKIAPATALRLLDEPDFRCVVAALLECAA